MIKSVFSWKAFDKIDHQIVLKKPSLSDLEVNYNTTLKLTATLDQMGMMTKNMYVILVLL